MRGYHKINTHLQKYLIGSVHLSMISFYIFFKKQSSSLFYTFADNSHSLKNIFIFICPKIFEFVEKYGFHSQETISLIFFSSQNIKYKH